MSELTTEQYKYTYSSAEEKLCQLIAIEGKSHYEACLEAYPSSKKWSRNAVDVQASKITSKPKIKLRIKELKNETKDKTIKAVVYNREIAFANFDSNIRLLTNQIEEIKADIELSLKDKSYLIDKLTRNKKEQEEQKAKLWSLFVDKKEIKVQSLEELLDELE